MGSEVTPPGQKQYGDPVKFPVTEPQRFFRPAPPPPSQSYTSPTTITPPSNAAITPRPQPRPAYLPFRRISLPGPLINADRTSVVSVSSSFEVYAEDGQTSPHSQSPSRVSKRTSVGDFSHAGGAGRRRSRAMSRRNSSVKPEADRRLSQVELKLIAKRQKIVQEIYDTEKAYVDGLELVYSHFLTPIISSLDDPEPLLNRSLLTSIFSSFIDIWNLHRSFFDALSSLLLVSLESTSPSPSPQTPQLHSPAPPLSPLLLSHFPYLSLYNPFVTSFPSTITSLTQLTSPPTSIRPNPQYSPRFAQFLNEREQDPKCGRLKLRDWLLTIIQRCPRYMMLIRDLKACMTESPEDEEEKEGLEQVLKLVSKITEALNKSLQTHSQTLSLISLQRSCSNLPPNFHMITPGRSLIKRGELTQVESSGKAEEERREVLLFSDCLVWFSRGGGVIERLGDWDWDWGWGFIPSSSSPSSSSSSSAIKSSAPSNASNSSATRPPLTRNRSRSETQLKHAVQARSAPMSPLSNSAFVVNSTGSVVESSSKGYGTRSTPSSPAGVTQAQAHHRPPPMASKRASLYAGFGRFSSPLSSSHLTRNDDDDDDDESKASSSLLPSPHITSSPGPQSSPSPLSSSSLHLQAHQLRPQTRTRPRTPEPPLLRRSMVSLSTPTTPMTNTTGLNMSTSKSTSTPTTTTSTSSSSSSSTSTSTATTTSTLTSTSTHTSASTCTSTSSSTSASMHSNVDDKDNKWIFKGKIDLVNLDIVVGGSIALEDQDRAKRRFEVLSPEGSFVLYADSEAALTEWTTLIRHTKSQMMASLNMTQPYSTISASGSTEHVRRALVALPYALGDERLVEGSLRRRGGMDVRGKEKGNIQKGKGKGNGKSDNAQVQDGIQVDISPKPKSKPKPKPSERRRKIDHYVPAIWIPDRKTSCCMRCGRLFGWRRRRHHCRLCGRCVCAGCSGRTFYITDAHAQDDAELIAASKPARACDACYDAVFPVVDQDSEDEHDIDGDCGDDSLDESTPILGEAFDLDARPSHLGSSSSPATDPSSCVTPPCLSSQTQPQPQPPHLKTPKTAQPPILKTPKTPKTPKHTSAIGSLMDLNMSLSLPSWLSVPAMTRVSNFGYGYGSSGSDNTGLNEVKDGGCASAGGMGSSSGTGSSSSGALALMAVDLVGPGYSSGERDRKRDSDGKRKVPVIMKGSMRGSLRVMTVKGGSSLGGTRGTMRGLGVGVGYSPGSVRRRGGGDDPGMSYSVSARDLGEDKWTGTSRDLEREKRTRIRIGRTSQHYQVHHSKKRSTQQILEDFRTRDEAEAGEGEGKRDGEGGKGGDGGDDRDLLGVVKVGSAGSGGSGASGGWETDDGEGEEEDQHPPTPPPKTPRPLALHSSSSVYSSNQSPYSPVSATSMSPNVSPRRAAVVIHGHHLQRPQRREDTARRSKRFSLPAIGVHAASVTAHTPGSGSGSGSGSGYIGGENSPVNYGGMRRSDSSSIVGGVNQSSSSHRISSPGDNNSPLSARSMMTTTTTTTTPTGPGKRFSYVMMGGRKNSRYDLASTEVMQPGEMQNNGLGSPVRSMHGSSGGVSRDEREVEGEGEGEDAMGMGMGMSGSESMGMGMGMSMSMSGDMGVSLAAVKLSELLERSKSQGQVRV